MKDRFGDVWLDKLRTACLMIVGEDRDGNILVTLLYDGLSPQDVGWVGAMEKDSLLNYYNPHPDYP